MDKKPDVIVYILPLLRYLSGPLLGPERLHAMAKNTSQVVDINAHFLHHRMTEYFSSNTALGDHAKPDNSFREVQDWAANQVEQYTPYSFSQIESMCMELREIREAVELLSQSELADFLKSYIPERQPKWIGISILFSGQALFSMLFAQLFRAVHPTCEIIVGGAHITALQNKIAKDISYGDFFDGFVFGPAEETFTELCCMNHPTQHKDVYRAGEKNKRAKEYLNILNLPLSNLALYGIPTLSIPAQTTRGCAYGKCTFCTYPSTEGKYRRAELEGLQKTIALAQEKKASLVFKDSYLVPKRIKELGTIINGRVEWAICTRVNTRFSKEEWATLEQQGLRTVEIGLESISSETLDLVQKKQEIKTLYTLFDHLRGRNIHLVINLMTGFPGESYEDWLELEQEIQYWDKTYDDVLFSVEKNIFQLEEESPMAKEPQKFGIQITKTYPWTNVCQWNQPNWVNRPEVIRWQGHHLRRKS